MGREWVWCVWLAIGFCLNSLQGTAQRVAAIGDYGQAGIPEQDVAALVQSWKPDFIITMGDNNYEYGEAATIDRNIGQYYHSYIYPYLGSFGAASSTKANAFFPSLGNHDFLTSSGQPYLSYFSLPGNERYYDYVRGNVHFFVLNSNPEEPDGISNTSKQAQWLQAGLANSSKPWKIVYFHHAPYSSGVYGNITVMQWPFKAWGASLVLAGHNHHYERLLVDGLTYIVNGVGGSELTRVTKPSTNTQFLYAADYGALLLTASHNTLTGQFFTRSGQLIDSFSLQGDPLPVSLTSFTAQRLGSGALLRWSTAMEEHNRGFGVEVALAGQRFQSIGYIASSMESSNSATSYSFTDTAVGRAGLYFYRLRQEDASGKSTYYGPVSVQFTGAAPGLSAYPNPFKQQLTLDITSARAEVAQLTLSDGRGRLVWQQMQLVQPGINRVVICPALQPGLYQATVRLKSGLFSQRLARF
jgi:hypothetical protein